MADDADTAKYYEAFGDLAGVCLEKSWVLDISDSPTAVLLRLDVVLTPDHPAYEAPKPGWDCYRRATLLVSSVSAVAFRRSDLPPAVDASGERDFGHIDSFHAISGEQPPVWELTGDWGEALVREPVVRLQLEDQR